MQNQRQRNGNSNNILRDLINDYNDNMNYYHSNIRRLIEIMTMNSENNQPNYHQNRRQQNNGLFTNRLHQSIQTLRNNLQNRFENIIVRPTQYQIENAVSNFNYDVSGSEVVSCPITMEPFTQGQCVSRIQYCGHIFSQNALLDWFSRNVKCPICRYDIRETPISTENIVDISSSLNNNSYANNREITQEQQSYLDRELDQLMNNDDSLNNSFGNTLESDVPPPRTRPTWQNFSNTLLNFVQQELRNNPAVSELIYTFDIPFTLDISNNFL